MFRSANLCDKCDAPTANPENEYGEFMCDNCEQNAAERAWDRQFEGEPPVTMDEQHQAAWHEHQKARRR